MGNSCTRNSEHQVLQRHSADDYDIFRDHANGNRSSTPVAHSVDVDALLDNRPSALQMLPPQQRKNSRGRVSKTTLSRNHSADNIYSNSMSDTPILSEDSRGKSRFDRSVKRMLHRKLAATGNSAHAEEDQMYHSYDDPGYMGSAAEMDKELILASPAESPTVIHARWGEPAEDPEEEGVCDDYKPNPFKLGFCVNCMKQHEVDGDAVKSTKEYKKIVRPTIGKYAANAADNPAAMPKPRPTAVSVASEEDGDRESDVDLTSILKQRRDILMKLEHMQEKKRVTKVRPQSVSHAEYAANRRTTMFTDSSKNATFSNLRRMTSAARPPASGPALSRGSSVLLNSPRRARPSSSRTIAKSLSTDMRLEDEERHSAVWL